MCEIWAVVRKPEAIVGEICVEGEQGDLINIIATVTHLCGRAGVRCLVSSMVRFFGGRHRDDVERDDGLPASNA